MPHEVAQITATVIKAFKTPVGIHTHNDGELGVANGERVVIAAGPIVGQLFGAGKLHQAGHQLHQAVWVALGLALCLASWRWLPETLHADARQIGAIAHDGARGDQPPVGFLQCPFECPDLARGAHADADEGAEEIGGDGKPRSLGDAVDVAHQLEAAAGLTALRTHYNVEIEHMLVGLLDRTDTDLAAILRRCGHPVTVAGRLLPGGSFLSPAR